MARDAIRLIDRPPFIDDEESRIGEPVRATTLFKIASVHSYLQQ